MRNMILMCASLIVAQSGMAMPCDTGWSCKTKSGTYAFEIQRCRYTNSLGNLLSVQINGQEIQGVQLTAGYDSQSIGGEILAFEVQIPDAQNDAHYLSVELVRSFGHVIERVQKNNPGEQTALRSEPISCQTVD